MIKAYQIVCEPDCAAVKARMHDWKSLIVEELCSPISYRNWNVDVTGHVPLISPQGITHQSWSCSPFDPCWPLNKSCNSGDVAVILTVFLTHILFSQYTSLI